MMRSFGIVQVIGTIATIGFAVIIWGLPIAPGILIYDEAVSHTSDEGSVIRAMVIGLAISTGVLLWGICLLLLSHYISRKIN